MKENEAIREFWQNIDMPFGSNISREASELAIQALEEVQQYQKIGTPEELQDMKNNYFEALSDWRQYRKIGTLEECRTAREKQIPKKPTPIDYEKYIDVIDNARFLRGAYWCSNCKRVVKSGSFCSDCGQKLDWSDEE
jgi:hypothetical protein